MRIGIPRALLYYDYFPMWETFLQLLGHQVIVSSPTKKDIVNEGVSVCVDDACLPVKLFHGHVLDLIGEVDAIFIPRLVSVSQGEFICPKFIGLPEMIKSRIKDLPKLLVLDFNLHKRNDGGKKAYMDLGKKLGANPRMVEKAFKQASEKQHEYEKMLQLGKTPLEILYRQQRFDSSAEKGIIAVIGHPYLLFDQHASMDILNKICQRGYNIIVPENISCLQIDESLSQLPKKLFWSYGKRLLGSGMFLLENRKVQGVIFLSSFGCGIDAFIGELLQRFNGRSWKIPYTMITLDEHSGQAGFETRLEAFLDMIKWRSQYDYNISSYGESLYLS